MANGVDGIVEHVRRFLSKIKGRVDEVRFRVETDYVALCLYRFQLDSLLLDHVGRVQID